MSEQAVILLLQLVKDKERKAGLGPVLISLLAIFAVTILLLAAILAPLMSPFELDGAAGAVQLAYRSLVSNQIGRGIVLTDTEIEEMVLKADTDDPDRQQILRTALSLVGRVPYFWGGKSAPGWNESWNTLKIVTAPGVAASGTLQPYGLDCSGFTDWVWATAGYQNNGAARITRYRITEDNHPEPGDLVIKNLPDGTPYNHIGIYYGKDENGKDLYIHCSAGAGGVDINSSGGFQYWSRPFFIPKEG